MVKDLRDHGLLKNNGDDREVATAIWAVLEVNIEHPLE
jgi:hypothetical protein